MRRKIFAVLLAAMMGSSLLAACGSSGQTGGSAGSGSGSGSGDGKETINLWTFTDEIPGMVDVFLKNNPDFAAKYEVKSTIIATTEGAYQPALDQALVSGGKDAPDIYAAEAAFVLKYTQGDMASFAASYSDLGIDVNTMIEEAQIAPYTIDIGSRDGDVVALGYQATGGALIYRRSLAKDVWGTDDPDEVKAKVGPGWDKYFEAAAQMHEKGYAIVSGIGDIWHAVENSSDKGWVVDGKLYIDPKREALLDYAKEMYEKGYMNDTQDWQDAWFADMGGIGAQPVFSFFGPAWLINYVMADNAGDTFGDWAVTEPPVGFFWGGTWLLANKDTKKAEAVAQLIEWITLNSTDDGLQYHWANGTLNGEGGTKDSVASATVMEKSDGSLEFLGGQNMFDVFVPANEFANGTNLTQYDESINQYWRDQVSEYARSNKSRDEAIATFKQMVADNLDVTVN